MDALTKFRKSLGLSRKEMALAIGISESLLEKCESGERNISNGFMRKLKKAYPQVDLNIFFAG